SLLPIPPEARAGWGGRDAVRNYRQRGKRRQAVARRKVWTRTGPVSLATSQASAACDAQEDRPKRRRRGQTFRRTERTQAWRVGPTPRRFAGPTFRRVTQAARTPNRPWRTLNGPAAPTPAAGDLRPQAEYNTGDSAGRRGDRWAAAAAPQPKGGRVCNEPVSRRSR